MPELDHLVCVVADLGAATAEFGSAGFAVHDGGRHGGKPTRNALIPLAGGAYLELLAFEPAWLRRPLRVLARTPLWPRLQARRAAAERPFADALARGGGLSLMVLRVEDLDARVAALRAAGFAVEDPVSMSRTTPAGQRPRWRLAVADDPDVPVLIEDLTARELRIPAAAQDARAVERVLVEVADAERAAAAYRVLLPGDGRRWQAGSTVIEFADSVRVELSGPPLSGLAAYGVTAGDGAAAGEAAERLAAALRFRTVSYEDHADIDGNEFAGLGKHFAQTYPRVHAELELQLIGHSRLYRWHGTEAAEDPDERAAALLLAHLDVVPVDDPDGWTHPPFDGVVADGHVWGRGAIDDKGRAVALLEAVEALLTSGFRPRRSVYLAFGHDEEIGGLAGAKRIARLLHAQGVRADFLLDEGGIIADGIIPGVRAPVASIMVGEKGFATVRLSTSDLGGHSSMPPKSTAVGRLARAVAAVQDHPMPLRGTDAVLDMVQRLAPFMRGPQALVAARARRLGPAIARGMARRPQSEAQVRTTTAPTVISGGVKANVLPQRAEALVNFRILPGDSIAAVLEHCRKVVGDKQVTVDLAPGMVAEPSPVSDTGSPAFELLAELAAEALPGCAVTTGLVPGATDARHYHDVADQRFNFAPVLLNSADVSRIHGTDERISVANLQRLIHFNQRLLRAL